MPAALPNEYGGFNGTFFITIILQSKAAEESDKPRENEVVKVWVYSKPGRLLRTEIHREKRCNDF